MAKWHCSHFRTPLAAVGASRADCAAAGRAQAQPPALASPRAGSTGQAAAALRGPSFCPFAPVEKAPDSGGKRRGLDGERRTSIG